MMAVIWNSKLQSDGTVQVTRVEQVGCQITDTWTTTRPAEEEDYQRQATQFARKMAEKRLTKMFVK